MSWYLWELRRHESAYAESMQLHELLDKLEREVHILKQMRNHVINNETEAQHLSLMVDQAKRVRRTSTLLIKALANERDNNATAEEAQANGSS